jgi:2-keto-4-pentenoate hydratase/2-oxohepta-3-ene-1,7-dioic acid hydratase in catechol pathway
VRIARIAQPDGFAFVAITGDGTDPANLGAAEISGNQVAEPEFTGKTWPLADVRLLAPILPSKVVCVGKNYADHAKEMGGEAPADPVIFLKPSTSIIGPNVPIELPPSSQRVDYEGELAVVVGVACKDVPAAQANSVILGYTVANDVTARDQQAADVQWTRAKGYDTFCPLGPWIETAIDASDVRLRTELDGELKQDSRTSLLLHDIGRLIEWITAVMTLRPGDVILTGTPAGVGPMTAGQTVSVTIDGIGTLTNPVVKR